LNERLTARERIASLAGSFEEQDEALVGTDPLGFPGYAEQLEAARTESGLSEACIWGWAEIDGVKCALVVGDFGFLGGSMGVAVGEKVANAFDAARRVRQPVVTVTASGGARMQEGMAALAQMASTTEAIRQHRDAGLAHVCLLTSPTTGGVYASFASLADVVLAEPGATVGFAGPRVVAELTGDAPPSDVHTAEFAFAHGLVDAIVDRTAQPSTISHILYFLEGRERDDASPSSEDARGASSDPSPTTSTSASPARVPTAWERLQMVRDPSRPKARTILDALLSSSFELRGDRSGEPDDTAVVVRLGSIGADTSVVAIGTDASGDGRIRPAGFRKAIRAIELAGRFHLPVLTIVDTRGADPLPSSEGGGVASAIAHTFLAMLECPSATLAAVTGEGGSGGALALAAADRVVAWENSVFSVIAPEGAAAILYRDAGKAPGLADQLGITVPDLVRLGIVDEVVPEPEGGAGNDAQGAIAGLAAVLSRELENLVNSRNAVRRRRRTRKWRRLASQLLGQKAD
jgi:acyl-CoA carboxylase subunit beta